jgi:hypothetical protein
MAHIIVFTPLLQGKVLGSLFQKQTKIGSLFKGEKKKSSWISQSLYLLWKIV